MMKPIAVVCADLHLCHSPPPARSNEPDWYMAMARPIKQLRGLAEKLCVPVLCAGDIFDRWDSPPELINWAHQVLPKMYAVPGQHDLPNHNIDEAERSAFWTLMACGKVECLGMHYDIVPDIDAILCACPWGIDIVPLDKGYGRITIVIAHRYIWSGVSNKYQGASDELKASKLKDQLVGYDVAVFGDNHRGFTCKVGDCQVINCGCLIPRKSDERTCGSSAGIIYDDGTVKHVEFDCSEDKWVDVPEGLEVQESCGELDEFMQELSSLDVSSLDFRQAVKRFLSNQTVTEGVRRVLLEALGE